MTVSGFPRAGELEQKPLSGGTATESKGPADEGGEYGQQGRARMSQERRGPAGIPDPHAMEVARVIQEAVNPDLTILYGSRAVGDHREDSDLDIMVVTGGTSAIAPESRALRAARAFIDENPRATAF